MKYRNSNNGAGIKAKQVATEYIKIHKNDCFLAKENVKRHSIRSVKIFEAKCKRRNKKIIILFFINYPNCPTKSTQRRDTQPLIGILSSFVCDKYFSKCKMYSAGYHSVKMDVRNYVVRIRGNVNN